MSQQKQAWFSVVVPYAVVLELWISIQYDAGPLGVEGRAVHAEVRVIGKVVSAGLGGQGLGRTRGMPRVVQYDAEL